ncbi:MAG: hypothetical protein ACT4RN_20255 [Pseudonocardia sp.]
MTALTRRWPDQGRWAVGSGIGGHAWCPADGWWACGCERSIPADDDVFDLADPGGGMGCAMAWRECRRCGWIDECPAAELHDDRHDNELRDDRQDGGRVGERDELEHRSGGSLCQDVPAGPVLPDHDTTGEHVSSEEKLMVERDTPTGRPVVAVAVDVVAPGQGLVTCGAGDFSGAVIRDRGHEFGSTYFVEDEWGRVLGGVRSYRAGAARLARHHGFTAGAVEVELEYRDECGGAR